MERLILSSALCFVLGHFIASATWKKRFNDIYSHNTFTDYDFSDSGGLNCTCECVNKIIDFRDSLDEFSDSLLIQSCDVVLDVLQKGYVDYEE